MNTEFIRSLIQQLSPLNRLILSRTVSLREKAMSVRKATRVLPVELSVVIASSVISDACYVMYAKILEIAILLYIRENRRDFYITRTCVRGNDRIAYVFEKVERTPRFDLPRGYRIPDNWLEMAVGDIVNGPMWSRVMLYIYDENVVEAILRQRRLHMDTDCMHHILAMIAPTAFGSLYALRVDPDVAAGHDDDDEEWFRDRRILFYPTSSDVLYQYLRTLRFQTWIDCDMWELRRAADGW